MRAADGSPQPEGSLPQGGLPASDGLDELLARTCAPPAPQPSAETRGLLRALLTWDPERRLDAAAGARLVHGASQGDDPHAASPRRSKNEALGVAGDNQKR